MAVVEFVRYFRSPAQASSSEEEEAAAVAAPLLDNSDNLDHNHSSTFTQLSDLLVLFMRENQYYQPTFPFPAIVVVIPRMEDPVLVAEWRQETVCVNAQNNHVSPQSTLSSNGSQPSY